MPRLKLITPAAATVIFACLPLTPAVAAGPLLVPWAVGHVVGAAVRLATLPFALAAAASAPTQSPMPAGPGVYYGSGNYYPPSAYYPPPGPYLPSPAFYGPQRYYGAPIYRGPPLYLGSPRFAPPRGYYYPTMRYSGSYGRPFFSGSRAIAGRRW